MAYSAPPAVIDDICNTAGAPASTCDDGQNGGEGWAHKLSGQRQGSTPCL